MFLAHFLRAAILNGHEGGCEQDIIDVFNDSLPAANSSTAQTSLQKKFIASHDCAPDFETNDEEGNYVTAAIVAIAPLVMRYFTSHRRFTVHFLFSFFENEFICNCTGLCGLNLP